MKFNDEMIVEFRQMAEYFDFAEDLLGRIRCLEDILDHFYGESMTCGALFGEHDLAVGALADHSKQVVIFNY